MRKTNRIKRNEESLWTPLQNTVFISLESQRRREGEMDRKLI